MFISAEYITRTYGVDEKIARFFVDREPPIDNLYWHKKLLYLRPSAGYIFIPLAVDLLHRLGIKREELLSDYFVETMEQIGHISALEEIKKIDTATAIQQCAKVVVVDRSSRKSYQDVLNYLQNGEDTFISSLVTPFKALHRGDLFLFSLCRLTISIELKEQIVMQWFALISTLLVLDDAEDIEDDLKFNEENAFIESGLNSSGFQQIEELINKNIFTLSVVNKTMAYQLEREFKQVCQKPELQNIKTNTYGT